jgi:gliding motility-associated-like protein
VLEHVMETTIDSTTTFWVAVIDQQNKACLYIDSVKVLKKEILCAEPEVYLPSAFSPNNDGLNDELKVYGKNVSNSEITIFDRWGNNIVTLNENLVAWDGLINGELAPEGVYFYSANVTCVDGQNFQTKGDITLLR